MERGFRLDRGHGNLGSAARWVEGAPEPSFWTGVRMKNRRVRPVVSYRCPDCGLLIDFAIGTTSGSRWAKT
jgi:hypothetical protein